jgi:hypothetical protein
VSRIPVAALAATAVVAGGAVAGIGLATRGGSHHTPRAFVVDETAGRVGLVLLGETRANVIAVLGAPATDESPGVGPEILRYSHLTVTLLAGTVSSIRTDDPAAVTLEAVRIGDPLSAARASYRKAATCNPSSPDKHAAHPYCRVEVRSGQMLITGDPIRTITLLGTR